MKKTNTQLAREAVGLMECIEDKFSLLYELDNVDIPELIEDSKLRVAEIFSHLNSVYNSSSLPLKSVVELAEDFDKTRFGKGDKIIYEGKEYVITAIDFDLCEIEIFKDDTNFWLSWNDCKSVLNK